MSDPLTAIEEVAWNTRIGRSTIWVLSVIQLCEWLTLFDDEYELIINAPRTFAKLITWCFMGDHDPNTCVKITHLLYVILTPYQLLSLLAMSLRSWAFAGRKTFVAAVLGCLYLAFAGTEIWVVATDAQQRDSGTIYPYTKNLGCFRSKVEDDLEIATKTSVLFIAASAIDLCCIIITWLHCLKIRSTQGSLGRIFLVQGFSAFLLLGTIHVTSAVMAISQRAAIFSGGFLLPVPLVLCNMVACRLVLHVRRRANPTETQISYRISNIVRNDLAFIEESPFVSKTSTLVS